MGATYSQRRSGGVARCLFRVKSAAGKDLVTYLTVCGLALLF